MKFFALIFLTAFVIFSSACAKTGDLKSKFDEPILEVKSNYWGLQPRHGEVVDIRLFEDAVIEYDAFPAESTNLKQAKVLKRTKIGDEQLRDFIDFLASEEFISLKDKYVATEFCFAYDSDRDIEIKFKQKDLRKQITIYHYCDVLPEPVSRLLEKIEKITNQRPA